MLSRLAVSPPSHSQKCRQVVDASRAVSAWDPSCFQRSVKSGTAPELSPPLNSYKILGTTSIPGTTDFSPASSVGGNSVGIGIGPVFSSLIGSQVLFLGPYAGGELFSEAIYSGKSFTDFGITSSGLVGTWTLQPASGSDPYSASDKINLIVGAPTAASVPGPLLGAAAAFGWSRKLRRRMGSISSGNSPV